MAHRLKVELIYAICGWHEDSFVGAKVIVETKTKWSTKRSDSRNGLTFVDSASKQRNKAVHILCESLRDFEREPEGTTDRDGSA